MSSQILDEREIQRLSQTLRAMAHPLRYRMLCLLARGEMNLQHLAKASHTSHSNASQHLALLQDQGLVLMRKVASRVYFRLKDPRTLRVLSAGHQLWA
ncbi:MAG: metalloregulator ArsR/SmtB family transcription factor [Acidithiobacillus sp.]|nr:metalloregulator ArsR/SmtB family transcription factor [Acidithiobacillus sp.]